MDRRPSPSLSGIASDLADLIYSNSDDHQRIDDLLHQLGADEEMAETNEPITGKRRDSHRVGIWKLTRENGTDCYIRDPERSKDWIHWADTHKIYPKNGGKRILLLGESVARGFLYAPFYTVARELEAIVRTIPEMHDTEVLDMSRTNLGLAELQDTMGTCAVLEPDAVVIFAGNNWYMTAAGSLDRADYATMYKIFREESFPGIKNFIEGKLRNIVISFLNEVRNVFEGTGLPVIFVVPEFNLKDWVSDEIERCLSYAPDNSIAEWLQARERALEMLRRKDGNALAAEAGKMVELDPSNPLGYELLAGAHLLNERWPEAIACFEGARDTALFVRGVNSKPRCYTVIRDTILAEAGKYGVEVVDLPGIFRNLDPCGVPGRELFLDYCHLTAEGIKIAMRHTARTVTRAITGEDIPVANISLSSLIPDRNAIAFAHFFAAVHNAHHGQSAEILEYHCRKALANSGIIRDVMLQYVDFATRYCSTALCQTFERTIMEGHVQQYEGGLALVPPRNHKLLDTELVNAMLRALHSAGTDAWATAELLRIKEHAVGYRPTNLLESQYCTSFYNAYAQDPQPCFLQARIINNSFSFISDGQGALYFQMVYRTPGREYDGIPVRIMVNDQENKIWELPMSKRWNNFSFTVPVEILDKGLNRLMVEWPHSREPMAGLYQLSGNCLLNVMFPVLGEIFSFTVLEA